MTIRPLTELAEFHECIALSRECFGMADLDLLPPRFFVVLNAIGGLVLGAFDDTRLVGFLNAMPGFLNGESYWHSQVMAVAPNRWNSGVGLSLKLAQRDRAIAVGIRRIEWTFDPLESKNAYLNLQKLGAIVRRYKVNYYGQIESALHAGLDTDRVIAEWHLDRPRVTPSKEARRILIPAEIQSLKKSDLRSAADLQLQVRAQFLKNLGEDYFAAGVERSGENSFYLFMPGASRAYPTH